MKPQNSLYAALLAFGLLSLVLAVFLISPTFSNIMSVSDEIASNRERAAFLYAQKNELDSFKKNISTYEVNLSKAEQLFIDPNDPVEFVKFLEKTAADVSVGVTVNLMGEAIKKTAGALTSSFQIYAEGSLQAVIKFTEKLETGPYLLQINTVSLSKAAAGDEKMSKPADVIGANFLVSVVNK